MWYTGAYCIEDFNRVLHILLRKLLGSPYYIYCEQLLVTEAESPAARNNVSCC